MILTNRKTGEEFKKVLLDEEAYEIVKTLKSEFARSLCEQYKERGLSPGQAFWFHKLAMENKPIEPLQLACDLQEFCSHSDQLMFEHYIIRDNIVRRGPINWGRLEGDKFYPTTKCPDDVKKHVLAFSIMPMVFLQEEGRRTGCCCVCGRELTNEESISLGIGPICREKW